MSNNLTHVNQFSPISFRLLIKRVRPRYIRPQGFGEIREIILVENGRILLPLQAESLFRKATQSIISEKCK